MINNLETLITVLQVLTSFIIFAGVPFSFHLSQRITKLESSINMSEIRERAKRNSDRVDNHEQRIIKLEVKSAEREHHG